MFQDLNPLDRSTAIMEIIILMLVAAIIGFVVAWLYYRSIYRKKISELEKEFSDYRATHVPKVDLEASQAALLAMTDERNRLRVDLANCQKKRDNAESEVKRLGIDLATTSSALAKSNAEIAELKDKLAHMEARLSDCERQLKEVTESRNGLIEELKGSEAENKNLQGQIVEFKAEVGNLETALAICQQKEGGDGPLITPAPEAEKKTAKRLKAKPVQKKLPAASKEDKLAAIREKRGSINFDRIGVATFDDRDDLKLIKGIGPFIEEKLNALGIFTFAQIARFIDEDVESVTKAIAFFPGRIQRDNWVAQAKEM